MSIPYQGAQVKQMLRLKDVAAELGIVRQAVTAMVKRGELTTYKIGGNYKFKREDIDAVLENARVKPEK